MSEEFSFEKKKKLIDRIGKLTNKSDLAIIKELIMKNNPELEFMKNSNGYFTQFDKLSYKTYHDILLFLDKNDKKKMKMIEKEILETSDYDNSMLVETSEKNVKKKLRLTNTENHVLNRAKYEHELRKNENNSDDEMQYFNSENIKGKEIKIKNQDDIFISKSNNNKTIPKKVKN
jgi:hypothetical protein